LKGGKATTLAASLESTGGLQMDNNGDLVACDEIVGVDIIPPPYDAVKPTSRAYQKKIEGQ
jgi:hypothetical protein